MHSNDISVEEAVIRTRNEALRLEKQLIRFAQTGKIDRYSTLSSLFKPLYDGVTRILDFGRKRKHLQHKC